MKIENGILYDVTDRYIWDDMLNFFKSKRTNPITFDTIYAAYISESAVSG